MNLKSYDLLSENKTFSALYTSVIAPNNEISKTMLNKFSIHEKDLELVDESLNLPLYKTIGSTYILKLYIPFSEMNTENNQKSHGSTTLILIYNETNIISIRSKKLSILDLLLRDQVESITKQLTPIILVNSILTAISKLYEIQSLDMIQQFNIAKSEIIKTKNNNAFVSLAELLEDFSLMKVAIQANIDVLSNLSTNEQFQQSKLKHEILRYTHLYNLYDNYLVICANVRDSYDVFISNDLNKAMKYLATITVIVAIPNIIFGFYGMNILLPFQTYPLAVILVLSVTIITILIIILQFKKLKLLN